MQYRAVRLSEMEVEEGHDRHGWVKATIWHPTRSCCRLPVDVLLDTGAGGGKYASESFVRSVERNARGEGGV